jgi:hypothetical protein
MATEPVNVLEIIAEVETETLHAGGWQWGWSAQSQCWGWRRQFGQVVVTTDARTALRLAMADKRRQRMLEFLSLRRRPE